MSVETVLGPTFYDGNYVRQEQLNRLSWNIDALAQITTGHATAEATASKPITKVRLTSSESVPLGVAGTTNIVTWHGSVVDTDGMWNASTPTFLTVQTAGWYEIVMQATWSSGAAQERVVQVLINGTADPLNVCASSSDETGATGVYRHQVIAYEQLDVGATIYGGIFHGVSGGLSLTANGVWGTNLVATWVDPY